MEDYGIIDLFAGPGGLGEGFSRQLNASGGRAFRICRSVEMDPSAHSTLRLRAFLRTLDSLPDEYLDFHAGWSSEPDWSSVNKAAWKEACSEALCMELGKSETAEALSAGIAQAKRKWGDRTVVIGGPPCQAYSLAGRSRNKGIAGYDAAADHRHFLFREYLNVLAALKPAVFIMENVKGLLSSSVNDQRVFDLLMQDLRSVGEEKDLYTVVPLALRSEGDDLLGDWKPSEFIIRAEEHGVPQARHRVILLGIRRDVAQNLENGVVESFRIAGENEPVPANAVLESLPRLRSGLSKEANSWKNWHTAVLSEMKRVEKAVRKSPDSLRKQVALNIHQFSDFPGELLQSSTAATFPGNECPPHLRDWLHNPTLRGTANHHSRGHMRSDLGRYFFAAAFATVLDRSPKASEFPVALAPDHQNWTTGVFADRFRVQVASRPSTTVTSHISKDGHYFIHPDPLQCRSLTVREAARLQTFPDDYMFLGNRTQQYVQVGNAVPPLLANRIAAVVHAILENALPKSQRAKRTAA
jgi:DNA (cytosine-5)-methyltransferase 1